MLNPNEHFFRNICCIRIKKKKKELKTTTNLEHPGSKKQKNNSETKHKQIPQQTITPMELDDKTQLQRKAEDILTSFIATEHMNGRKKP